MATRQKLYAKYGQAAEAAQLFETVIGTIVLAAYGFNNGWHVEPDKDAAAVLLRDIDASTLGSLLSRFRRELTVEEGLLNQFVRAKKTRDSLFHGFFERHNYKIQTPEGRDEMVADLENIHEELFRAWRVAEGVSKVLVECLAEWREAAKG